MPLGGVDGVFMCIVPALLTGLEGKCFEEVRIEDYLKAYQATGKPPLPCPQEPTDATARKALNLPPLFVPHSMGPAGPLPVTLPSTANPGTPSTTNPPFSFSGSTAGSLSLSTAKPKITNPSEIPAAQEFRPKIVNGGISGGGNETFESIVMMDEYLFFSMEELRCYAYMRGQKLAPPGIKMDPFAFPKKEGSTGTSVPGSNETLESITANTLYDKHSVEELRVAYLLSHRDMTSAELMPGLPAVIPPIAPVTSLVPPTTPLQLGAAAAAPLQLTTPITPLQIGGPAQGIGSLTPATPAPAVAASSFFGTPATTTPSTAPRFSFNFTR